MPICSPKMHWVVVWCEVNANRQCAFGCVVTITDDAIRNVEPTPDSKPWLTGCVLAMPICPVEVFGCLIQPGQLIHADKHGFMAIPEDEQAKILDAALFMDGNECDTVIALTRNAAGHSTD